MIGSGAAHATPPTYNDVLEESSALVALKGELHRLCIHAVFKIGGGGLLSTPAASTGLISSMENVARRAEDCAIATKTRLDR
jgi:hypothetical protein